MLGRRNPQRDLFGAQNLPHRVPEDSLYGRMAAVSDILFNDDDLKEMYCVDNGRPSLPPSLMSGILMLQFHNDVSDEEARDRAMFDRHWQVALDLPLDFPGFDPSSLSNFRKRLVEHGQERYAFDRFATTGVLAENVHPFGNCSDFRYKRGGARWVHAICVHLEWRSP